MPLDSLETEVLESFGCDKFFSLPNVGEVKMFSGENLILKIKGGS